MVREDRQVALGRVVRLHMQPDRRHPEEVELTLIFRTVPAEEAEARITTTHRRHVLPVLMVNTIAVREEDRPIITLQVQEAVQVSL